jgi:hypothetical protein
VEILLACLGKTNKIAEVRTRTGGIVYKTQIGDVALCRWLLTVGITPAESLTIGGLAVPDDFLLPLARGLLDGDGSIMNKVARADTKRRSDYHWEYLQTKFVSASRRHLVWLRERLQTATGLDGYLMITPAKDRRQACYALRFSKHASVKLLPLIYADANAPRLTRKWSVWADYAARHDIDPHGRSPVK